MMIATRQTIIFAFLLSLFAGTVPVSAQDVETVEVSGFEGLPQEQSNWCWAASVQSLFLTRGLEVDQATIVTAAYGGPVNATAPGFEGTLRLLNSVVVDINGDKWRVRASAETTYPEPRWVLNRLQDDQPVMIWFRDQFTNYSIVLIGGEYYTSRSGSFAGWRLLTAYDPFLDRTMTIDGASIPRFVYGTFKISISRAE